MDSNPKAHTPCPVCGGKDRFRFDNLNGTGSFICSQGGQETKGSDGLSLLADHASLGIEAAKAAVVGVLNDMQLISPHDGQRATIDFQEANALVNELAKLDELQYQMQNAISPHNLA